MDLVSNSIVYCVIALAIIVFSVLSVTSRKILRSATYLLFTLFATAALYFQLGYEFLGAVQIAVYAGATSVENCPRVYCKGYTQQEAESEFSGKTIIRVDA